MKSKKRLMRICENLRLSLTTKVFIPALAVRLFIAVFGMYQKAVNGYEIPMDSFNEALFKIMDSAVVVPVIINALITAEIASLRADIIHYLEARERK